MRKIQTQADIDRKKRKNQIILGVIMIGLLVLAPLGYSLLSGDGDSDSSKVNENGVDFFRQNGIWMVEVGGAVFRFQNLPSKVSNISVNVSVDLGQYSRQPLYFVNPNEGANEVLVNIGDYILRYQEACLSNETCKDNLPVKGCDANLIIFETDSQGDDSGEPNYTEVYQDGNCIFIVGDSIKGTDAFLYKVLQII